MDNEVLEIARPDGATLRVECSGEGPPLVLLHGTLTGRSAFSRLRPHLSDGRKLVLPVQRGHEGTPAVFPEGYGLDTTEVSDLEVVMDELGLSQIDIVGHSTGGAIGLAFALQHPDRVRSLALVEPTVMSLLDGEIASEVRASSEIAVAAAKRGDHRRAVMAVLELVDAGGWSSLPETTQAKILDALEAAELVAGPHVQALLDLWISPEQVSDLEAPMLFFYGDSTASFEHHIAARFAELRPDARQILVEGAGHNNHSERADIVGPEIAGFLAVP